MPRQGLRVTIWNEHVHKREDALVAAIYPEGIHGALAAARRDGLVVRTPARDGRGRDHRGAARRLGRGRATLQSRTCPNRSASAGRAIPWPPYGRRLARMQPAPPPTRSAGPCATSCAAIP